MNLNLRKASAIVKDLQFTVIPNLTRVAERSTRGSITTLVDVDVLPRIVEIEKQFADNVELLEKALHVVFDLRVLIQKANMDSGINSLVSELTYKKSQLSFYQSLTDRYGDSSKEYSVEEVKVLLERTKKSTNSYGNYENSITYSVAMSAVVNEKIEQLTKEIKILKNEKLLGANFSNTIAITEEMKSILEELKVL